MKHLCLFLCVVSLAGCGSMSYYWQAINGHAELLNRQQPISEVLQSAATTAEVRERLALARDIQRFAREHLHLPDNGSYTQYADLGRPYALWNVVATPQYSIAAKQWCFLFAGCLSYRGYYDRREAEAYAESLRQAGYDVMVSGARAYSTLGWFADPLLNTMLYKEDTRLAGIVFHELAHQQVYKKASSAFNEAFAMAVEIEGVLAWLAAHKDAAAIRQYTAELEQHMQFNRLLRRSREKLQQAYALAESDADRAQSKQRIFAALHTEYQRLKQQWQGDDRYDPWMAQELNNAHLALLGTYYDYVPYFRNLLRDSGGNFPRFYAVVDALSPAALEAVELDLAATASRE